MSPRTVSADAVRPRIDAAHFEFDTTDDLPASRSVGEASMRLQPRARAALDVAVAAPGFHVFASGSPHLVKLDAVLAQLLAASGARAPAADWAYVHDDAAPDRPWPLRLPSGQGPDFVRAVADAVNQLQREIPRMMAGGNLRRSQSLLEDAARAAEKVVLAELKKKLRARHFDVRRFEGQLEAVPLWKGKAVTRPLARLPAAQRKAIEARLPELSELVEAGNRRLSEIRADFAARHATLRREVAQAVARRALAEVERAFSTCPDAVSHLERLRGAVVEHHALFTDDGLTEPAARAARLRRFAVHLLVTHQGEAHAPVIKEGNPTHGALFGATWREVEQGVLTTDFTHLRPGALHRANGGFLVLPARVLLAQPEVWAALKRGLRTGTIHFPEGDDGPGPSMAQPLCPRGIALECSVVLTGEVEVYEALYTQDPDFRELFGVRADFADTTPLDAAGLADATQVLAALIRKDGLLPFDGSAVARTLEFALRLADDQQRLSLEWDRLRLLLVEASHEAKKDASPRVRALHVRRAEEGAAWRSGLHRENLRELMKRGVLRLQVAGAAVGQVNALALSTLGDSVIGRAARVSARVGPGMRGLVDIEHRASLSGPVHAKAVLQLQGYLLGRFGAARPLALDATLTFEQSYFAIEGDSASVAELVALVSALTSAPVRQGLAVSCSLGQDGGVQAVGGVSDKVEGFFDACQVAGLDGTQGVILAENNVQHLVLRDDVVEAIEKGRFHLHAVEHVDDVLELLLGLDASEVDSKVAHRLDAFAVAVRGLRELA